MIHLALILFVLAGFLTEVLHASEPPKMQAPAPYDLAADAKRKACMSPEEALWESMLEQNLGGFYLPIYKKDKLAGKVTAWDFVKDDPKLPRVLLIGDSISRGYTLVVRRELAGKANVHRAPANCGSTEVGLKKLPVWLGDGKWDLIHFNFGIHDRKTDDKTYAANLETLTGRLAATGAKLVWARTTPPADGRNEEGFTIEQCDRLNQVADGIMRDHGIAVNDLHSMIGPRLAEVQLPANVHFSNDGYEMLGRQVAARILATLAVPVECKAEATAQKIEVSLDLKNPGAAISSDFSGLSFETKLLCPSENGVRYFRPDNQPLIRLFQTLGIKSLRVGGNSSDRDVKQLPGPADLDSLFGFAKAAGVKVIYGLQLHKGDPEVAARTVKLINEKYAPLVECFSIGQEPSAYPVETVDKRPINERMGQGAEHYPYPTYAGEWKRFGKAIIAAVPEARFCGPGVHNDGYWTRRFIQEFGRGHQLGLITAHLYPGGAAGKVPTPEAGCDRILSKEFETIYQKLHAGFVQAAAAENLSYRLEEVNSFYNGGAAEVSDSFASALWGLDFMHWWAARGAQGLNFHTGDQVAAGNQFTNCKYSAFVSTGDGYDVHPLGYAIKTFDLGGRGRVIPVAVKNPENLNMSLHAVLAADGSAYLTAINKEHGAIAKNIILAIKKDTGFPECELMRLTAPEGDVSAKTGVSLGNGTISVTGAFDGKWERMASSADPKSGIRRLLVPAASAVVIRLISGSSTSHLPSKPER